MQEGENTFDGAPFDVPITGVLFIYYEYPMEVREEIGTIYRFDLFIFLVMFFT